MGKKRGKEEKPTFTKIKYLLRKDRVGQGRG